MNVSLRPELDTLIHAKVATAWYSNASEALGLLKDRDVVDELKPQPLWRALSIGLSGLDRGEFSTESLEDIRCNVFNSRSKYLPTDVQAFQTSIPVY